MAKGLDQFDLKNLGLGELKSATGTISATDYFIVVDPTTFQPRLELVGTLAT